MNEWDEFPNVCCNRDEVLTRYSDFFSWMLKSTVLKIYAVWDIAKKEWNHYSPVLVQCDKNEYEIFIQSDKVRWIVCHDTGELYMPPYFTNYTWKEYFTFDQESIQRIDLIDSDEAIHGIVFTTDKREFGVVCKGDAMLLFEGEDLWKFLNNADHIGFRLSNVEDIVPKGKHYDYKHFARIFKRDMQTGMYPEVELICEQERFHLQADLNTVKLFQKREWEAYDQPFEKGTEKKTSVILEFEKLLLTESSLSEIVNKRLFVDTLLDKWSQIEIVSYDDEYDYCFDFNEHVFIKSIQKYGIVKKRPDEFSGELKYGILVKENDISGKSSLLIIDEADLEYDMRPETIEEMRQAHQLYLCRISE